MSDIANHRTTHLPLQQWPLRCRLTRRQRHAILVMIAIQCILAPSVVGVAEPWHDSSFNSSVLSATIKIVRDIKLNHSHLAESNFDPVFQYERIICSCLSKITSRIEKCVHQFNESFEQHSAWIRANGHQTEEKVRRYCCVQNEFKDCWTTSIRQSCSELETRLAKWLPLQMLKDLRTDDRCRTFVLYPHKCRENFFSLWQILAFLLLMPFVAFAAILFSVVTCKPEIAYKSLTILRTNQGIDV